jgi:NADPH:quinone reductase-like Zn-dependent oxidoreductase
MKAAVITRYGSPDVVKIREASKPTPAAGEVLIRVHATTVNRTDCGELQPRLIGRLVYGLRRPRRSIFGMDFAGVVEAVGAEVMSFKPGDRLFGMLPISEQWRSGRICLCARERTNRPHAGKHAL